MAIKLQLDPEHLDYLMGIAPEADPNALPMARPAGQPFEATPKIGAAAAPEFRPEGAMPAPPPTNIPKPTEKESRAAGRSEFKAGMPTVTEPAGTPGFYGQKLAKLEYEKAHPWGSPVSAQPGFLGKVGHIASKVGNIAGDILAPATTALIPGTDLNKQLEEKSLISGKQRAEKAEEENKTAETENELRGAQTEEAKARTEAIKNPPEKNVANKIAFHYQTDDGKTLAVYEDGMTKELPPEKAKETAEKYPGLTADELAMFPPPSRDQFKTDAEFAQARANWGKKVSDFKQHQKLQVGLASREPLQKEFAALDTQNGNRPVYVTPQQMAADPARYMPAPAGAQALGREALITDIKGSITNLQDSISRLDQGFTTTQRAALAAAIADPQGTMGQFIQSIAREPLSPAQQDYVIDLFQLREQAMAMRSVLGAGQGSEDLRRAIVQTLPGPGTPSADFGKKQLDRFMQVVNRLERGVPNAPLNTPKGPTGPEGATGETGGGFADWKRNQGAQPKQP